MEWQPDISWYHLIQSFTNINDLNAFTICNDPCVVIKRNQLLEKACADFASKRDSPHRVCEVFRFHHISHGLDVDGDEVYRICRIFWRDYIQKHYPNIRSIR
jgi:hypothetical protein